jgi:hypothetical protein
MIRVICSPWKRTFTLSPLALLAVISPIKKKKTTILGLPRN